MKLILSLISFVALLLSSALCAPGEKSSCPTELPKAIEDTCVITASHVELATALLEYMDNKKTREEFKKFNDDYCNRSATYINCAYENGLQTISETCTNSEKYGLVHLITKYQKIFSEYYCENDGVRQMESIEDDGVDCLFAENHINCLFEELNDLSTMCQLINGTINCERHFDGCVNQKVKLYRSEIFRNLSNEFNCS